MCVEKLLKYLQKLDLKFSFQTPENRRELTGNFKQSFVFRVGKYADFVLSKSAKLS